MRIASAKYEHGRSDAFCPYGRDYWKELDINSIKTVSLYIMHLNWPGISVDNTLIIPVDKSEFGIQTSPLKLAGKIFKPKREAHITVFGSSVGTALQQQITYMPEIEQQISHAFENTDWSYNKTTDFRHLVRTCNGPYAADATEESIIILLEMEEMAAFYQSLKVLKLIDNDLPVPPPHVTLYTFNCDRGIGVHSQKELAELTYQYLQNPV
jgi:hypothetical protein